MMSIAAPKTIEELTSSSSGKSKSCIPCIVHSIASDNAIDDCNKKLHETFDGYICLTWTLRSATESIQKRLPSMKHLCMADDNVKMMTFPYLILYLFGGIYIDSSATCIRNTEALLYHYASTILFFFMAPPAYLASRQLSFGVTSTLMASAPRIDAMYTLINIMGTQAQSASYAIEVHDGIVNQFVRAALNGSQESAVVLLSDKYISDESGKYNLLGSQEADAPDVSDEIDSFTTQRIFINQARVKIMKAAQSTAAFERLARKADAVVVDDAEPVDCLILDTEFDAERPIDASMDVALLLHSTKFSPNAFVLLRKGCDSIALVNLKMLGAEELMSDDVFSVWQLTKNS